MSRARRVAASGVWLWVATGLGVAACGGDDAERWTPAARLVERIDGFTPERPVPMTRLGGEGRPVLRAFPELWLGRRFAGREGEVDPGVAWFALPESGAAARHVVLSPEVAKKTGKSWTPRPLRLLEVEPWQGAPAVRAELALPEGAPATGVWARAHARVPIVGGHQRIETAPLPLPTRARLDFGFGLLPEMKGEGAVTFSVSVCVEEDCTEVLQETVDPSRESDTWRDRSLPIEPLPGVTASFRFEASQAESARGFMLPVWSDPTLYVPAPSAGVGPNLILVSLDTLRADRLPAYGYPLDTAPFLSERIATEGALFENAVAPANMTGPSHITAFTSLPPSVHGLRGNIRQTRLPDAIPTLAEALRAHGFTTGAVTENGALTYGQGIERGFATYRESHPAQLAGGLVEETLAGGRAWLERHGDRRFFLFLHTYEAHTPYHAPDRYPKLGLADETDPERWDQLVPEEWHPESYDREIRYTDDALKAFLEGLERDGLLENTLVVLFADHGEAFLEHDVLQHAGALHQEVLHVPLLFWGAGAAPGVRATAPVGLIDLMPTLLELMGVPAPDGLMGRSFAPLVRGEPETRDAKARPLYSESWSEERAELRDGRIRKVKLEPPAYAVRVGARKLIRENGKDGPRDRYYDLALDPGEKNPLDPAATADLRNLLDAYPAEMRARRTHIVRPGTETEALPLDPDREEALRALGYLE